MQHLTEVIPKPMLKVHGKNLIEHKIIALPAEIGEVVLVIGYLGDVIRQYFGNEYAGKKITYVEQKELRGTGYALHEARHVLGDRFLVLMGDDIYSKDDIKAMLKYEWAMLVRGVSIEKRGARVVCDESGNVIEIIESQVLAPGDNENAGMYIISKDFFNHALVKLPGREEWGLPQTLVRVAHGKLKIVQTGRYIQLTVPEDLAEAEAVLKETGTTRISL